MEEKKVYSYAAATSLKSSLSVIVVISFSTGIVLESGNSIVEGSIPCVTASITRSRYGACSSNTLFIYLFIYFKIN